jgi:aminoglycoside phosphotransferase family enzyme/predicted kinase
MAPVGPSEQEASGAGQDDVIAFLSDPGSYHQVERVERMETHGNLIFLAGKEAWKLKREVNFAYMDFSTLAKRHAACIREMAINQRFGSPLYLGCVPIARSRDGVPAFGRNGQIVEWTVHMRRFDQAALLNNMARKTGIANTLASDLADVIYAAHQLAERDMAHSGTPPLQRLAASVSSALARSQIAGADVKELEALLSAEIDRVAAILNERASNGFVRRCHGDLHLANIIVWDGRPALYDAIEFDEAIATIDTLYDLAFLLMDLDRYNQRAAANLVLNRYLWRSGEPLDLRGLCALPLFLALRAAVRAMVLTDRAALRTCAARESDLTVARAYLQAALDYLQARPPQLIAIGGCSGTGKTTVAANLACGLGRAPGAVHLRTDLERKRLAGVNEFEPLPASSYSPTSRADIYQAVRDKARRLLTAGHSVIMDAVFAEQDQREAIEALAAELGVPFQGLWLYANPETLLERVALRRKDASDATPDVVTRQLGVDPGRFTAQWRTIDAGGPPQQTLATASAALKEWARSIA